MKENEVSGEHGIHKVIRNTENPRSTGLHGGKGGTENPVTQIFGEG
jgi:hypothetical protein